ncbi:UDP-glucose/GDP-mannose dehydrogenase family protein [Pseudomonas monteilii]|uniref:UDP-glucose 6-dehydrogenase n=1 Tax=Pseudomonas monteilii TaxID=76759 RepID=A0AAP7FST5_9PSED|nr:MULTISPECIES: UDP-glucose/GDP-mannose dehydrogenase family protein [Pseudomonas]KPM58200.1 UDP-glucose 6-dehydrogenase [Pseudomonas putida]AYN16047.1 UDP-glucose/GDP-mannose dehydrogenase family protein [Pseudomonas monteilii]AYO00292.1 UDP-glucose/GDP-mannose dehydrogenase family protein [Pseudomonas sp. LTGT-11-2Z]MCE0876422.1 UDP-glucose/GDP-mannose dehydrogenase family protein [Pseudomonas monteilii]MCE0928988.1 UDP-glucose/GDP-mannose dehydrogenase family protein [Pseudomonas monteilii
MKVTVFGTGYVGLTQAACLAHVGHSVLCMDVDAERVATLNRGHCPIFEPGLAPMLEKNLACGRLRFTTDTDEATNFATVLFIAVGTPAQADGSADLKQVFTVVDNILKHAEGAKLIVNKSTAPVGTVHRIKERIAQAVADTNRFQVISNPEFLKEGSAVDDCMRPERIIIGGATPAEVELLRELYLPFNRNREKFMVMDARSAELSKYAANCMLATKISFMNEIANLAEHLGADIEMVRRGIGSDSRIGYDFIYAGCGFGGSCFPKDLQALRRSAEAEGFEPQLLRAVESINEQQKGRLFNKIQRHYSRGLRGKVFALWGLSFKPNTNDIREASSRVVLEALWAAGARVQAHDPQAMPEILRHYGPRADLQLVPSKEAALQGADALVIVTEWQDYRVLNLDTVPQLLADRVVFDGRNLYEPEHMASAGLTYYGIGRGQVPPVSQQ